MRLKLQLNLLAVGVISAVATFVSIAALLTIDRLSEDLSERLMRSEVRQIIQRVADAHLVLKDTGVDTIQSYVQRTQADFLAELRGYRLGETGRIYIISGNLTVLLAGSDRSPEDIRTEDIQAIANQENGSFTAMVAGKDSAIYFDSFDPWNWKVLVSMSDDEINAQRDIFLRAVMVIFFVSILLGVGVFAWVATGFVKPVLMLADQLSSMTSETMGEELNVPESSSEVSRLVDAFRKLSIRLAAANLQRNRAQQEVEQLNASLERRVEERTRELESMNKRLQSTVVQLETTREELVNAEKLASLGSLVAGVAHELNTPIGNAVLCASTLAAFGDDFRKKMEAGLRRSDLDKLLSELDQSGSLLMASLEKAALLVRSFKEVAVDRASERRRLFSLEVVVNELVVTCSHEYKNLPYKILVDVDPQIELDSYPGPLGQVVMNLLRNAMIHGFEGRDHGTVRVRGRLSTPDIVLLEILDDGHGIPVENHKRVFEPFFTTKLGKGGSGLGLHVAYNIVTNVLGGEITVDHAEGGGAHFSLRLPVSAPEEGSVKASDDVN